MKLREDEKTGGPDQQLSAQAEEGAPLVSMEAFRQTDKVLARLRKLRVSTDVEEGFFRDWPDFSSDETRLPSWHGQFIKYPLGDPRGLQQELMRRGEIIVAWLEALDRRADERRGQVARLPWWPRLKYRLTGRF